MTIVYEDTDGQPASDIPVRRIKFTINGEKKIAEVEPRLLLSHLIRRGLGLTGVGGATIGATEAAAALTGQPLTADRIAQAADLAAQAARPRTDHRGSAEYKRHMVRTFVVRLLSRTDAAAERAA